MLSRGCWSRSARARHGDPAGLVGQPAAFIYPLGRWQRRRGQRFSVGLSLRPGGGELQRGASAGPAVAAHGHLALVIDVAGEGRLADAQPAVEGRALEQFAGLARRAAASGRLSTAGAAPRRSRPAAR